jgi:hypothetical protein
MFYETVFHFTLVFKMNLNSVPAFEAFEPDAFGEIVHAETETGNDVG